MRRASRTDANQSAIVSALRAVGCEVLSLAAVGKGCPDLLVNNLGKLVLMEVKDGDKPPSARRLTDDQLVFHAAWPVVVVHSVAEAFDALGIMEGTAP